METSKKSAASIDHGEFVRRFAAIVPLIHGEWPDVDSAALEKTDGDFDQVTSLIAVHTDQTKARVRRQLAELYELSVRRTANNSSAANGSSTGSSLPELNDLIAAVKRLEALAAQEARKVSTEVLPRAEAKVKENLLLSLLFSLGLGMILGLLIASGARRDRHE